jgi:hypothetical protein
MSNDLAHELRRPDGRSWLVIPNRRREIGDV